MADKLRTLQNLEALQARYVGTGHADTTKHEWMSNIVRDSYASYVGHPPLLAYMALGMGEPKEKVRVQMIEKMVRGAGNPPEVRRHPIPSLSYRSGCALLLVRVLTVALNLIRRRNKHVDSWEYVKETIRYNIRRLAFVSTSSVRIGVAPAV